jgi:protein-S-isoprenylcysteine O-methyltransferase Ste14
VKQTRNFWTRFRVRAGYPVAAVYLLLATPTVRSIAIGGIVSVFGLIIRAAASGHLRKDQELATGGPYSRTRNPLYVGSALLAIGFIVGGHALWGGLVVAVYFAVFYHAAIRSEEARLQRAFGAAFESYAARVPAFFPRLRGSSSEPASEAPPPKAFSYAQYRRNREYEALIGTVAGLGVLWLRMWLRARYGY